MTGPQPDLEAGKAGRDALITYAIVAVSVAALVQINITLPAIGHLGSALVSVLFLYAPMIVLGRRKEDLIDYGFRSDPITRMTRSAMNTSSRRSLLPK